MLFRSYKLRNFTIAFPYNFRPVTVKSKGKKLYLRTFTVQFPYRYTVVEQYCEKTYRWQAQTAEAWRCRRKTPQSMLIAYSIPQNGKSSAIYLLFRQRWALRQNKALYRRFFVAGKKSVKEKDSVTRFPAGGRSHTVRKTYSSGLLIISKSLEKLK